MAGKRKDLVSLLRLHSWIVDQRRRELAVMQLREDALVANDADLGRQFIDEKALASAQPNGVGYNFGAYAERYRRQREQLQRTLADLRVEIDGARERVAEAYRELKVYEEVETERKRLQGVEENRQEQIFLDEIAQTQYRRRDAD